MNFREQLEKIFQDTPASRHTRDRIEFYLSVKKLNGYDQEYVTKALKQSHYQKQITVTYEDLLYLAFQLNYPPSWGLETARQWKIPIPKSASSFNEVRIWQEARQSLVSISLANISKEEGKLLYLDHQIAIIGLRKAIWWELARLKQKQIREAFRKIIHSAMQVQLVIVPDLLVIRGRPEVKDWNGDSEPF